MKVNRPANSPKLAPYFRTLAHRAREHHLYAHMFREDVVSGIMPLGGRSRYHPNFAITFEGSDHDVNIAKSLVSSFSERSSRNANEIFCRAIEEIARSLSWDPLSRYEIVENQGVFTAHDVSSRRTVKLFFFTFQYVPREEREVWKSRLLYQHNRRIWSVSMPKELGGARGYRRMINQLEKIPQGSTPDFVMRELDLGGGSPVFDFNEYSTQQILYINKATSKWDWHRRDWSDDKQCEFYRTYKRAMFKYSQLLLREHLVSELNALISRLGIGCTVKVDGLPTASDMLQAVHELDMGKVKFKEVYDLIYD